MSTTPTDPAPRARRVPRWVILVTVVLVLVIGGVLFYLLRPLEAPIPVDVGVQYAGLERGYTEQGFPRLGSADAPVLVEDFSSYACPHCGDFHNGRFPALLDEIAAGQVQFVMIPVPHIGSGAKNAAQAALCAGEQGQYWEMHDVLFAWQDRFIVSTFDARRLKKGAENLGLDTAAFNACLDKNDSDPVLDQARLEFDLRGLRGTPSFFINGQRVTDYKEFDNLGELAGQLAARGS